MAVKGFIFETYNKIDDMKQELKVGLTLVGAIMVVWGAIWWAKDVRVGQRTATISFVNVSGLQIGDPVTVRGLKVGKVEAIEIPDGRVAVQVSLMPDVKVYRNATARLTMLELMTGKKIELELGTPESGLLAEGDVITGLFTSDIPQLVGFAGEAIDTLRLLISDVHIVLKNANTLIGDKDLQEDLKVSVKNFRRLTEDLGVVGRDLRQTDIKGIVSRLESTLMKVDGLMTELQPELKGTLVETRGTVRNADALIRSLKELTDKLQQDRSSLAGKVLNDEKFMARLDSVIMNLNAVLKLGEKDGINVKLNLF
jgi:phospholipid/cholesterol/gamma-HCH transport system substrate-binding protein